MNCILYIFCNPIAQNTWGRGNAGLNMIMNCQLPALVSKKDLWMQIHNMYCVLTNNKDRHHIGLNS